MSNLTQIQANRLNAQKSTGPRSATGKSTSRMNALKSGLYAKSQIVRGESQADFEALKAEYHNHYRPASPAERSLVDDLVNAEWLKRRFRTIEAQLLTRAMDSPYFDSKNPVGFAYDRCDADLNRLQRRIDSTDRLYHRALTALRKIQLEPEPTDISELPAVSPTRPIAKSKLASFRHAAPTEPAPAAQPVAETPIQPDTNQPDATDPLGSFRHYSPQPDAKVPQPCSEPELPTNS